jgi:integrase
MHGPALGTRRSVLMQAKRTPTGIAVRHSRSCGTHVGQRCSCTPAYQAQVWSTRDHKTIRKTFRTISAAKTWRQDANVALRKRTMRAPTQTTLRQAWEAWLTGAKEGWVRTRSGDAYKPSALRSYEHGMQKRVLDEIGGVRLSDVTRTALQDLADRWLSNELDPSTIRNTLMPLRALFRRAHSRGEVAVNPTAGLELPAVRGRRDRVASPKEAAALIAAVPEHDRALWATAFYTGLRRGELMALRWEDVDLEVGLIRVERSWDIREGLIEPKSRAGRRTVPIATILREHLVAHALRSGRRSGLLFGRTEAVPFEPTTLADRAATAWRRMNAERSTLELNQIPPISLHECRHTFASLMIAAGVNAKALSTYMGHSSITITLDRYGHLMPGNETQAAELLDGYLARAIAR